MSQQIIKNWHPLPEKSLVSGVPDKKGEKLGYKKFHDCEICNGIMIADSYCTECKNPIDLICMQCGQKIMYDNHEFCYCQLEVLTTKSWTR
ncbi:hypothetical protein [Candidatus Nitrosotenuis aquarius]|uniref:hypothetical protein n=1 Tax=Candidatus Nitrosotenuis aquarius TaxID=1846278 RepID=UPI000C1E02C2|nr:hypothetical protein [Candidatus Nitrosotenuis aquarius]